jgi:hypothetical protein
MKNLFNRFTSMILVATVCVSALISFPLIGSASVAEPPFFFDFDDIRNAPDPNFPLYIPMPAPGWYSDPNAQLFHDLYDNQAAADKPCAMALLRGSLSSNAPIDGTNPLSLSTVLGYIPKMDFVYEDFEYDDGGVIDQRNIAEMVRLVRTDSDPDKNQAWLCGYREFPGPIDLSEVWVTDRTARSNYYATSGLNVASPACYEYASYSHHYEWDGSNSNPNLRAAMFWSPLEKFSTVAREIFDPNKSFSGHIIVPHVNAFQPVNPTVYGNVPPERSDIKALIQHYRLRGSSGFIRFGDNYNNTGVDANGTPYVQPGSWLLSYTKAQHRQDLQDSWTALDSSFSGTAVKSILNQSTNKTGGIEWSGIRNIRDVKVLVSNMGNSAATVSYPTEPYMGLPATSTSVPIATHQFFTYYITNLLKNYNFNTNASNWTLGSGTTWDNTDGHNANGCLKNIGGFWMASPSYKAKAEPNVKLRFVAYVKGNVGAKFNVGYYYYDKNGTQLGFVNTNLNQTMNGDWKYINLYFNMPSDRRVYSITPVLYNANNLPTDTIKIDDAYFNFD